MHVSCTLLTHVVLVLMVLPNSWNQCCTLIPFWRASLAVVLEYYERERNVGFHINSCLLILASWPIELLMLSEPTVYVNSCIPYVTLALMAELMNLPLPKLAFHPRLIGYLRTEI
jgi:hypothetical protein